MPEILANYKIFFITFFLFLISLIIRLNFGYDSSLWLDEIWRITISRNISVDSFESIWKYLLSFEGFLILNDLFLSNNQDNYRILFVLVSSLSAPLSFLLARNFFNFYISFLIGLLLATHSWHVTYSNEIAAYAIGTTLVLSLILNLFHKDRNKQSLIITLFLSSVITLIHPYFIVFTSLIIFSKYVCDYLIDKDFVAIVKLLIILVIILLINSGQIYTRFFEYSSSGAFVYNIGASWKLGFPIYFLNLIFLGPFENRWVPTSNDAVILFKLISVLLFFAFLISITLMLIKLFKEKKFQMKGNFIEDNNLLIALLFSSIGYIFFIYIQAYIVNGAFLRYLLPILPIMLILIIYLFKNTKFLKRYYFYLLGLMIFINMTVLLNSNFNTYFKNPYKYILDDIQKPCANSYRVVIAPSFLELAIVKFYLDKSNCEIIEQPSFLKFFEGREKNLIWQNEEEFLLEDAFILNKLESLNENVDSIAIISFRSKERLNTYLDDPLFNNYMKVNDMSTKLNLRVIEYEKSSN